MSVVFILMLHNLSLRPSGKYLANNNFNRNNTKVVNKDVKPCKAKEGLEKGTKTLKVILQSTGKVSLYLKSRLFIPKGIEFFGTINPVPLLPLQ